MKMNPTWQSDCGRVQLYLGDCRDILPSIGPVDAVVTDPPYGIGFKYESHDDSPEGYGEFIWSVIQTCEDKLGPASPCFVFQAMLNVRKFAEWFPRPWRIYAAAKNFIQIMPVAMQYAFDPVVCWWTESQGERKPWTEGTASRDFFVSDTASIVSNRSNAEKGHPCPRPLCQMLRIVEQWVRPDSIVIDPFMGSGTTGVACVQLNRRFIGVEKEPKYFEIAKRRIMEAMGKEVSVNGFKQRRMFA